MNRAVMKKRVADRTKPWDMVIIGGGATGLGCALDAASRGYEVLLVEKHDFGKGTSSRSTKLVHGGVRYLEQGNVSLVMEALRERGRLRANAPHLFHELGFVVPNYHWWEKPYYGLGLKVYQLLSGKWGFGKTKILSKTETVERFPSINMQGLNGGVVYFDGQFDDARLLISLAETAVGQGATLLNYAGVNGLIKDSQGKVTGVGVRDEETKEEFEIRAKVVINATGAFCDEIRELGEPQVKPLITPSQGIHLVFDASFLEGEFGLMVPRTDDGRVMFAIPWHGHTLIGTTDTPIPRTMLEPLPFEQEIDFILSTAGRYLRKQPTRNDVLSVFVGIRPLVKASNAKNTAALSRDHTIQIEPNGLLTITGGKWTTYRYMAEDCINQAAGIAGLDTRACQTKDLRIHGFHQKSSELGSLAVYGATAKDVLGLVEQNAALATQLHTALPYIEAQVIWAVRNEMARSVEDVLARRLRALFLNAQAAIEAAPRVAQLMAAELGRDENWMVDQVQQFKQLGQGYLLPVS